MMVEVVVVAAVAAAGAITAVAALSTTKSAEITVTIHVSFDVTIMMIIWDWLSRPFSMPAAITLVDG